MKQITIFICGNGNISLENFLKYYQKPLEPYLNKEEVKFVLCEFRGTDSLALELLKTTAPNVTVLHMGKRPRYMPDRFKTYVSNWEFIGGFQSDKERDRAAIAQATHFIAKDFNSDSNRKSGTQKNIEYCLSKNLIQIQ